MDSMIILLKISKVLSAAMNEHISYSVPIDIVYQHHKLIR